MADRIEDFLLLCRLLSIDRSPEAIAALRQTAQAGCLDWRKIIDAADRERLAPTLWDALRRKGLLDLVPPPLANALKRRYSMNALIVETTQSEMRELFRCLNRIGISPILLKGSVRLADPSFGNPKARVMRDVDILVPVEELERSVAALSTIGYRIKAGEDMEWTYCYPAMVRQGCVIPLEVHRYVGQQNTILPPKEAWRDAVDISDGNSRMMCLSPSHQVFLNVFHSEVADRGFELGLIWLRQLLSLAEICHVYSNRIDWNKVAQMMRRHALEGVLASRLYLAHRLLALPLPLSESYGLRSRLHYYRCIVLLRWPSALAITRGWAALTAPFKRYHIALTYGCGLDPVTINFYRIRHVWHIFRKYRGTILERAWQRRRYDIS